MFILRLEGFSPIYYGLDCLFKILRVLTKYAI